MKRRIALTGIAVVLLTSCSTSSESATTTTSSPTTTPATTVAPSTSSQASTTTQASTTPPDTTTATPQSVTYSLTKVGSFADAVDLTERSASDGFYYVVSRAGTIQKWSTTNQPAQTVLDVSSLVTSEGERGLLGLAFRKVGGQWFAYINHTDRDGNTQIAEYTVTADGSFNADSRRVLLSIEQPYANHNGGGLAIGPDNMLYIGMGDGGSSGDPERRARKLNNLLGKILRINPTQSGSNAYTIPADNPYVGVPEARGEIWSIGLRNPWRFSFDTTGNLWIADVGQNKWEEINMSRRTAKTLAGRSVDYGWSAFEATHRFNEDEPAGTPVEPIFEYSHSDGNCSVSGSAVATSSNLPLRKNWYFFGDFCSGRIWAMSVDNQNKVRTETVMEKAGNITGIRSISKGVFVLTLDGDISRLSATAS